jgi:secreted Zn-dependent insulinase-like peptidase
MGLYSPLANASARDAVLLQLYASMVSDWLNPKLYPALLTGFNTRLGASRRGLELGIDGFSDKQTGILDLMLHEIQQAPLDSRRFADIKLRLERSWQNRKLRAPYEYLPGALSDALYTNHWSEDDKLAAAADLTVADLERYRAAFLADMRLDILFYGNVTEQQTSELRQRVSPLLAGSTRVARLPGVELAMLDDNSRWLYPQNLEHSDAAMMYYVQGSSDDNEQRALMGLTGQIIRTPYYNSLRTEQQLGYVVYATTTVLERMPGLSFIVQSPVADATTLVAASEKLMQQFDEIAQQMTEGEFAQHKLALASLINRPHKNLSGAAGFLWDQIQQDYTGFDRREQLTGALEQLDLPQWRQFYRDNFMPRPHRALIVTQYGAKPPAGDALKGVPVIDDVDAFKRDRRQRAYP